MAIVPFKISYTIGGNTFNHVLARGPMVECRKVTQVWGRTDTTGATTKKSMRRRRAVIWRFELISSDELNRIENFIDKAEDLGAEYFTVTTSFANNGNNDDATALVDMYVYRADENEYEAIYGKDWIMRSWKYKIVFIEPIGKALNGIKDII